jgi:DNA-binding NarL/FixJ family response regulator
LMAEGLSNPAIAQRLYLSLSSIEKHVSAIFSILGVGQEPTAHRRVAAVLAFLRES